MMHSRQTYVVVCVVVADKWTSGGTMINNLHRYQRKHNERKREMSAHHKIWITILIENVGRKNYVKRVFDSFSNIFYVISIFIISLQYLIAALY